MRAGEDREGNVLECTVKGQENEFQIHSGLLQSKLQKFKLPNKMIPIDSDLCPLTLEEITVVFEQGDLHNAVIVLD